MNAGAVAVRGEVELARIAARVLEEFADARDGRLGGDHQNVGAAAPERAGGGVLLRVGRQEPVQRHVDRVGRRRDEQRVAVGRALRDEVGADIAAGAGLVLDDDRLSQGFRKARAQSTRGEIGDTARRESDDEPDRLGGIVSQRRQRKKQSGGDERYHPRASRHPPLEGRGKNNAACLDAGRGFCSRVRTSYATRVIWSTASSCVMCPAWPIMRKWPRPPTLSTNSASWLVTSSGVPTNMIPALTRSSIAPWCVSTALPSRVVVVRLPRALIMRAASFTEKYPGGVPKGSATRPEERRYPTMTSARRIASFLSCAIATMPRYEKRSGAGAGRPRS